MGKKELNQVRPMWTTVREAKIIKILKVSVLPRWLTPLTHSVRPMSTKSKTRVTILRLNPTKRKRSSPCSPKFTNKPPVQLLQTRQVLRNRLWFRERTSLLRRKTECGPAFLVAKQSQCQNSTFLKMQSVSCRSQCSRASSHHWKLKCRWVATTMCASKFWYNRAQTTLRKQILPSATSSSSRSKSIVWSTKASSTKNLKKTAPQNDTGMASLCSRNPCPLRSPKTELICTQL